LHFDLHGKKLQGIFHLVQLKNRGKNQWLLMKKKEEGKKGAKSSTRNAPLTNLDKLYWPKEKITKGDLIQFYTDIAPYLLPYLKDRPESLKRFPEGINGITFFQKNLENYPDWIETVKIKHESKTVNYLLIQNVESLIYAANLGCIELHPFFSRTPSLHNPDFLIIDLDPKSASFDKVIKVAQSIHEILEEIDVPNFCKTSGATGLHIVVPLGAKYTYEEAKNFAVAVANVVISRNPDISTLERSISKRKNRVYIDCFQNNFGQTVASVYSVRARPGAPVSTPLKWSEVKKGLDPKDHNIKNILPRLKKIGDIFAPVLKKGIDLKKALLKIEKLG
jgi:bifunctional non-homologous end joining protein LigD